VSYEKGETYLKISHLKGVNFISSATVTANYGSPDLRDLVRPNPLGSE
jgi:hypothetical protein